MNEFSSYVYVSSICLIAIGYDDLDVREFRAATLSEHFVLLIITPVSTNCGVWCLDRNKDVYRGGPKVARSELVWRGAVFERFSRLSEQLRSASSCASWIVSIRRLLLLRIRESCKGVFREPGLLTLPCIYILDVVLYCRLKYELVQGSDVHQYETRGRDNFRIVQLRTTAFEHLPSQVGVKLINKLPEG
ncbi:hypothetical protein J6590_018473 [Homalodisca vitripennis]|nr:hypothetical protein J6590_018473 [Homalodisca vitripennis]